MDFKHRISNISKPQIKILDAKVSKEEFNGVKQWILSALVENCPFYEGEEIEIDTDAMKLTGHIVWRDRDLIKIKMSKLVTITPN